MYGGRPCKAKDGKIVTDIDYEEKVKAPCDTPMCPKVAAQPYWSTWKDWGPCEHCPDIPCDEQANSGIRKRTRKCQIGRSRWTNLKILRPEECKKKGLHGKAEEEEQCAPPCGSYSKC